MKRYFLMAFVIGILALAPAFAIDFDDSTIQGLNITSDIDDAFNASEAENKMLMIVFDQDSCVYCDIFKNEVLSDSDVQSELNENFIVLIVDINENPDIADKYDIYGTPSIQFVGSDGKNIEKIDGGPDVVEFLDIIKGI